MFLGHHHYDNKIQTEYVWASQNVCSWCITTMIIKYRQSTSGHHKTSVLGASPLEFPWDVLVNEGLVIGFEFLHFRQGVCLGVEVILAVCVCVWSYLLCVCVVITLRAMCTVLKVLVCCGFVV